MWQAVAVPYLKQSGWASGVIHSRTLKFWGIGESTLAEKVGSLLDSENPTVAPYANEGEVKLRLSAKAESVSAANELIDPVAAKIRQTAGAHYYGQNDESLASVVGDLLLGRSQTLSVAESCTGGGLGQLITATPGSSSYFWGVVSFLTIIE